MSLRRIASFSLVALGVPALSALLSFAEAGAQTAPDSAAKPATAPAASASVAPPVPTASTGASLGLDSIAPASSSALQPRTKKRYPPPKDPSAAERKAQDTLREEVLAYEESAKAYRDAVTDLVRFHYEAKRRDLLSRLDESIVVEKAELKRARELAITRLEEFVAKYTGPRSQQEATPDAMFRLAALYEERARADESGAPVEDGLKPAIALYKRIVSEYPQYAELASVFYFLGHAYNDAGRGPESQQVWRSLVCHNKYSYPTAPDPKDPEADTITPMAQDHDEAYWAAWRARHQNPKSAKAGGPDGRFDDPFPATCQPIVQPKLRSGEDPKYVAEIWWQIGNYQFDLLDAAAGVVRDEPGSVYGYNRAASAYQRALAYKKPPIYSVALYKYSWTLFKQQRYEAATKAFVALLVDTDEQEKNTGDSGANFRTEAYTYIAGSLTNLDFAGPGEAEPFIQRPDILDTEPRPEVAEQKLRIGIARVQDPAIIPQDKPWTIEIYKALAAEYRSISQYQNAVATYDLVLSKWPMDPTAPEVQAAEADTYDEMARPFRPGTPEYEAIAKKALESRTKLSNYIGKTAWVEANKNNPAALKNAERLVRVGLRQAAVAHTNNGRAAMTAAQESGDARQQIELLVQAREEYRLAAVGWNGFLRQDENAPDAYESRYWLADSLRNALRIQVALATLRPGQYPVPKPEDMAIARTAALDVRDSNEDDKYLDNAAFFVVDIADIDRDVAYTRNRESAGREGVPERTEVQFTGEGDQRVVVKSQLPDVVLQSIAARDEYSEFVPPQRDLQKNSLKYRMYSAETYFLYGQFREAEVRYEALYREECGKSEYGYKAWEKLITMSNLERNADRSRALAEAEKSRSCAVSESDRASASLIVNPTLQEAAYVMARRKFEEARKAPPGPGKDKLWREAAGLYEAALQAAPARDEAPEAAMNAAYAYKQVGEYGKAIAMYDKFIAEYGSEERMSALQKGDAKAKVAPDPKRYEERLKFLNDAYDALGTTYYSFFNYGKAAETYERVAKNERFPAPKRKDGAKNAMTLYASMGQKDKMLSAYRVYDTLKPSPEEKISADYLVAAYEYRQWSPAGADTGENKQHRIAAQESLGTFYNKNANNKAGGRYTLEAAYLTAKMRKTGGETPTTWWKNTIAAWERFKGTAAVGADGKSAAMKSPYVDYAAEADFTLVDQQIAAKYDDPAKHKYAGSVADVLGSYDAKTGKLTKPGKYQTNANEADKWDRELERIVKAYPSVEWVPTALARRGTVWDALRTGLYNAIPPNIKYFTPQQEKLLKQLEDSGRPELQDKADALRDTAREGWRTKKETELNGADNLMVRNYASSVHLARKYNVRSAYVQKAIGRLAYFTDIIGDAKLRGYVTQTADPSEAGKKLDYKDGQYLQSRPGLTAVPKASGKATVLPITP